MPNKNRQKRILDQTVGTELKPGKPFSEGDREQERRFKTSLPGFRYTEEEHEASRYLSRTPATATVSSRYQVVIPKEVRAWLKLKPGQKLRVIEKNGVIRLVPIPPLKRISRTLRRSEQGSLSKLNEALKMVHKSRWTVRKAASFSGLSYHEFLEKMTDAGTDSGPTLKELRESLDPS